MITYTNPVPTPDITRKRLVRFAADPVARSVTTLWEIGYASPGGAFIKVEEFRRVFTDFTVPSFADFVAACPAAAPLRKQVEEYEITLSVPGTAD